MARVLAPSAKLATARALDPATASHSLGATLELGPVKVKELYATLDWLGKHQEGIERRLARRHLGSGTLVLYDVTSSSAASRAGSGAPGARSAAPARSAWPLAP